MMITIRQDKY